MGNWTEPVSALASLGCLAFGFYTFWRSRTDKRDEKLEALEAKVTDHGERLKGVERIIDLVTQTFKFK